MPPVGLTLRRKPKVASASDEWIAPEDEPPVVLTDEQRAAQAAALSGFYGAESAFGRAFGAEQTHAPQTRSPLPDDGFLAKHDGFLAKLKEAEARDATRVRV